MEALAGGIIILWLLMLGLGIAGSVFWVWIFISAVKHQYEHKPIWIIILLIGSVIGAIAFYFSVHKKLKAGNQSMPTQTPQ